MTRCCQAVEKCVRQECVDDAAIATWHEILFRDFVPLAYYAGNFRQVDPTKPCLAVDVHVDQTDGTPHPRVRMQMKLLSAAMSVGIGRLDRDYKNLAPADRAFEIANLAATVIGRFIRIHPFINGNGRVSRAIWLWILRRYGVPAQVKIDPRPLDPYEQVMSASMNGNDGPLAAFILQHLAKHPPVLSL